MLTASSFVAVRSVISHLVFFISGLCRNLRQAPNGLADEINFEDFLTIMSYFRPIEMNMDEEQLDHFRKEKLKCETSQESPAQGSPVFEGGLHRHPTLPALSLFPYICSKPLGSRVHDYDLAISHWSP